MQKIIPPIDKKILLEELTTDKFVRNTNNGNNKIYIFTAHNSPNLMRETGRLREITFREAGGGTGLDCDIDIYDTSDHPFFQLIVWNPEENEIVGGYRFAHGKYLMDEKGQVMSPTGKLFQFSEKFISEYLPFSIELGRSFVQPAYQPTVNLRKGMYSLDNLWDGLGAMIIDNPDVKYFFGKVTMYPQYNRLARDLVLFFLQKHFPDKEGLLTPIDPLKLATDKEELRSILNNLSYEDDYKVLVHKVRQLNENVPPLVNAYMNLSATMRTFGTSLNLEFGEVEETGILVTIKDIYDFKKDRHLSTYKK